MRKLASIRKIDGLFTIQDADKIELAKVDDWFAIVKRGEFNVGDEVVYIEIDSVLPPDNPHFAFMEKYNYRVRTIKMRGVYSQGLIFPISIIPHTLSIGDDVTDILGITKYEIPETFSIGNAQSNWGNDTPKTDEERIQNLGKTYEKYQKIEDLWIQSVKLDGTSVSYQLIDGVFRVFSHNCEIIDGQGSLWEYAINNNIETRMRYYCSQMGIPENIALQGEMVGPGIQQNRQKFPTKTVLFFYIFDRENKKYLSHIDFVKAIEEMGLKTVPILSNSLNIRNFSVAELLDMAEQYDVESETRQEGFVIYAKHNHSVIQFEDDSHPMIFPHGRISFKVKSNKYVLDFEVR
jgi:RNA ligase (TIGR02306 family)